MSDTPVLYHSWLSQISPNSYCPAMTAIPLLALSRSIFSGLKEALLQRYSTWQLKLLKENARRLTKMSQAVKPQATDWIPVLCQTAATYLTFFPCWPLCWQKYHSVLIVWIPSSLQRIKMHPDWCTIKRRKEWQYGELTWKIPWHQHCCEDRTLCRRKSMDK